MLFVLFVLFKLLAALYAFEWPAVKLNTFCILAAQSIGLISLSIEPR